MKYFYNYLLLVLLFGGAVVLILPTLSEGYSTRAAAPKFYPQWRPILVNRLPVGRHGMACAHGEIQGRNTVACFGGRSRTTFLHGETPPGYIYPVIGDSVTITYELNDLNVFDLESRSWTVDYINNTGDGGRYEPVYGLQEDEGLPYGRAYAKAVLHNEKLFVYGGTNAKRVILPSESSLIVFDFATKTWQVDIPYDDETDPAPRYGHSAVLWNGRMWVFGGYWHIPRKAPDPEPHWPEFSAELWSLDLTTLQWECFGPACNNKRRAVQHEQTATVEEKEERATGGWPSGRSEHSAVVRGNSMYIWGGTQYESRCFGLTSCEFLPYTSLQELWRYDFLTEQWTDLSNYTYTEDTPVRGFDNVTIVYSPVPLPRQYHGAAVDINEEFMVIFGGIRRNEFLNDIHKYYFDEHRWEEIPISYPACDPRYGFDIFPTNKTVQDQVGDIFFVTSGRRFNYQDISSSGELYVGPLSDLPNEPGIDFGETNKLVVRFDRQSPSQRLIPIDECGKKKFDEAVIVKFRSITERSPTGDLVQKVDFERNTFTVNFDQLGNNPDIDFELDSSVGLEILFGFTLFPEGGTINYANTNFSVDPSTNKWSFSLSQWVFLGFENKLVVEISLELASSRRFFTSLRNQTNSAAKLVRYEFLSGKLRAKVAVSTLGIVDSVITPISHDVIFAPQQDPVIRFTFPHFVEGFFYDPDFGVVVEPNFANQFSCEDELQPWEIATIVLGILIPTTIFCGVVAVGLYLYFSRRRGKPVTAKMIDFGDTSRNHNIDIDLGDDDIDDDVL